MTHYDSPWKEAIGLYFEQFLEFFFPEVQSQPDEEFGHRILLYHTRIADKFGRPLCSLAILGDSNPEWRPDRHAESFGGCQHELHFPTRKLLDYPSGAEQPNNVFSWLTAGHLQAQATRGRPTRRAEAKIRLVRGLYTCGLGRTQIVQLFRLLDWVLALPKQMEYDFRQELQRFEEEQKMVYVTSIERMAREEGLEEGLEQGLKQGIEQGIEQGRGQASQELVSQIIERATQRWGSLDPATRAKLEQICDLSRLVQLLALVCGSGTSEEFEIALA